MKVQFPVPSEREQDRFELSGALHGERFVEALGASRCSVRVRTRWTRITLMCPCQWESVASGLNNLCTLR